MIILLGSGQFKINAYLENSAKTAYLKISHFGTAEK
jgi:hypothetical protein